jgi:predicted small secreted protein
MKRVSALMTIFAVAALFVSACGASGNTAAGGESPRRFKSAGEWIQALNKDGVSCRSATHPGQGAEPAGIQPAACDLANGDRLTVLLVDNAAQMYRKQFAKAKTSQRVLYGANWIVIAPKTAPAQSIQIIKDKFHARG